MSHVPLDLDRLHRLASRFRSRRSWRRLAQNGFFSPLWICLARTGSAQAAFVRLLSSVFYFYLLLLAFAYYYYCAFVCDHQRQTAAAMSNRQQMQKGQWLIFGRWSPPAGI
jgi:hypothetical protein